MRTKPISFQVEVTPTTEHVNDDGEYVFGIYAASCCNDEIEQAIQKTAELWEAQYLDADVSLTIHVRTRSLYENLFHMYNRDEKIHAQEMSSFEALKNDCQWIVDQINKLEVIK